MKDLIGILEKNSYPGRGIVTGICKNSSHAFIAYFIMGRSENSRNRVFEQKGGDMFTQAADPAKLKDPSLIIYSPLRVHQNNTIVTNGDQTDTIYSALARENSFGAVNEEYAFEAALRTRTFEPDPPNFTPRISALLNLGFSGFSYKMSILKSADGAQESTRRFFWEYPRPLDGQGHFIHTYSGNMINGGLESFSGEPLTVYIPENTENFQDEIWNALDEDNKVSLFIRTISPGGSRTTKIYNKYSKV